MRIISYIAMIATAALCQLSSCMNQADTTVDGNQPQPAGRTIDVFDVRIPEYFISTFRETDNIVIDFDNNEVRIPCIPNISVSWNSYAEMGKTLVSIEYRRLPGSEYLVQTGDHVVAIDWRTKNTPSGKNIQFSKIYDQTWKSVVKVNWNTKSLSLPSRKDIQPFVVGSECNASLSIVHNWSPTSSSPAGASRAFQAPLVEMRSTIEGKEENAQRKMGSEIEIDSEDSKTLSEDFETLFEESKTLKKKTGESKPPKQAKPLEIIEDPNSHIKKSPKKEAKKIEQFDRKAFLDKYSKQRLDEGVKDSIKVLFNSGITAPAKILDKLLTPRNNKKREKEFHKVVKKICGYINDNFKK